MKKIIFILLCLVSFSAIADGDFNLSIGHWFGDDNGVMFNYQQGYQNQYWNRPYYEPYNREYYPPQYEWNQPPTIVYKEYHYRNYWRRNDDENHQRCIVKYHTYFFNRFTGRYTFETHYIDRCNHEYRGR